MNYCKQISLIIFMILLSINTVEAANWVNTKNSTKPVVFLDTKSIYKFNNGAVYAIRYFNNNKEEVVATIYTDLENKVGIIAVTPYKDINEYNYNIPDDINMKAINSNSSIYNSLEEVKNIVLNEKVKYCSHLKCSYVDKYDNNSPSTYTYSNEKLINADNVDFEPYMKKLQKCIKNNWNPPQGNKSKSVILLFSIAKDGSLLDVKVHSSSGSIRVDNAAIQAVKATAPFDPLPSEFNGNSVDIQFTFDYNVFGVSG